MIERMTEVELIEMRENGQLDATVELNRRERYWVHE